MSNIYSKDKWEKFLEKIYVLLENKKTLYHISCGYLSAIIIEFLNQVNKMKFLELLKNTFDIRTKPGNILTYLTILIVLIYVVLKKFLKKYFEKRTIEERLKDIYKTHTNNLFEGYETEGIGWGLGQTVMNCPNLFNGWSTDSIKFEVDNSTYDLSAIKNYENSIAHRNIEVEYNEYLKNEFSKKYDENSDRLMLVKRPVAMTDNNTLRLKLKKVKWSQLTFMWDYILTNDVKKKLIKDVFDSGVIINPNSFCLHLVVITEDDKILITQNSSNKANDYSKSWAVSIGEQLDMEDLENQNDDCAYKWVKRALCEELSVYEKDFNREDIHFLSVNLEGDIINYSFVCIVKLKLSSKDLVNRISIEPKIDNEFCHLDFINVDDIPDELLNGTREYHPSSPIRMLYTYLHKKGASQLRDELLKKSKKI